MKKIEIKGKLRTELGKRATRELRKQGMVPCNLYGGEKNINFYAHENEFTKIIYTPEVFEIELDIDGDKHRAIIQELQFHPVKDNVMHCLC
jgi:large subunit ribosomal protein L25